MKFSKKILTTFVLIVLVGIASKENSWATQYLYYDAEDGTVGNEVPLLVESGPKFCQTQCSGLGDKATVQSSGGAAQGSKYFQWQTVQSQNNHYTEISNVGVFPVSLNLGTTYYMAYYMRFDRINEQDIWHEGGATQSSDKGVEISGSGLRWGTGRGQWDKCEDSYSPGMGANDDHHFTIMVGNPTYHLDPSILPMPTNLSGYGCGNTRQYTYETWYSVVLGVKMATDNTGSVSMWVDGEKVLEFLNTPTVGNSTPTLSSINIGGTIAQGAYDSPPHYRKFDALMLTDNWQDIVDAGYLGGQQLTSPEIESINLQ